MGTIVEREFMTGTIAIPLPWTARGMRIKGERLWVADADGLHAFDPPIRGCTLSSSIFLVRTRLSTTNVETDRRARST